MVDDDPALAGGDHLRRALARHERRADEIDVEHRTQLLERELGELAGLAVLLHEQAVADDARVVHEPVDPAHRVGGPADEGLAVGLARHVEPSAVDALWQLGEQRHVDITRRDLRAERVETTREVRAHAAGSAGDDDLQIFQLHLVLRFFLARARRRRAPDAISLGRGSSSLFIRGRDLGAALVVVPARASVVALPAS